MFICRLIDCLPTIYFYCGGRLHDCREGVLFERHLRKEHSRRASLVGTWQTLGESLATSPSLTNVNRLRGAYFSAFSLSSGYSFVSSAVSVC